MLVSLSSHVKSLPLIGEIPYGLVIAAVIWSLAGTGLLALIGIKLPGLEFNNQRVEAAYRKELVYGEDDASRAAPPTVKQLFKSVRKTISAFTSITPTSTSRGCFICKPITYSASSCCCRQSWQAA